MVKKILSVKLKGIIINLAALLTIFLSFQNCQKVHFGALVDTNAFNDQASSALFCSTENTIEIRVPTASFDPQSVCTDSYNLNGSAKLGKICEEGPEVFAIPETSLEYKNCSDLTICGVKYESKILKNKTYVSRH